MRYIDVASPMLVCRVYSEETKAYDIANRRFYIDHYFGEE